MGAVGVGQTPGDRGTGAQQKAGFLQGRGGRRAGAALPAPARPARGSAGAGTGRHQGANPNQQNYYSICVPVNPDAVTEIIANNESYISKVIKLLCARTLFF